MAPPSAPCAAGQEALLAAVGDYYSGKVKEFGPTPLGADWSCEPTQQMRFVQLLKLCDFSGDFSLNDLGCGYGALLEFLAQRHRRRRIDYLGMDISSAMIAAASARWSDHPHAKFLTADNTLRVADYSLASGIFNVRLKASDLEWEQVVRATLKRMHGASHKGFSVNFLMPPAQAEWRIPELYYARPDRWAAFCEQELGLKAEIVSGYGLREYTLLLRRQA